MTRAGLDHRTEEVDVRELSKGKGHGLFALVIVPVALILSASACSSGHQATTGATSAGSTAAAETKLAPGTITVMSIATVGLTAGNFTDVWAGVQGAAKDVDASGGINGRQLRVVTCNDDLTPTGATECADQAVSDHVTAVVGMESNYMSTILPILNAARIPSIGSVNSQSAEVTSPNSYTFTIGTNLEAAAGLTELIDRGYKKVAVAYIDVTSAGPIVGALKTIVPTLGNKTGRLVAAIPISQTQTDMSSITAAIQTSGAQAVLMLLSNAQADLLIQSNYQAGIPSTALPMLDGVLSPKDIASLGPAANGVYYVSNVLPLSDTSNAAVQRVLNDFASVHYGGTISDWGTQAWAATIAAADVMKASKAYTAPALLAALPRTSTLSLGIVGPVNWRQPLKSQLPQRIYNPNVLVSLVKNGVITPLFSTFENVLGVS